MRIDLIQLLPKLAYPHAEGALDSGRGRVVRCLVRPLVARLPDET